MTNEQRSLEVTAMPFWKACLLSVAILVVAVIWLLFGQFVLKLHNPWVGFLALTTFGALYNSNLSDAPKVWIGGAVALLIAYSLWYVPTLVGPAGALVGGIIIALCLAAFLVQKLPVICNFAMFIMLTAATAAPIIEQKQHLTYLLDLAYSAICFWFLPLAFVKLKAMQAGKSQ